MIEIYTKIMCPFCHKAKALLKKKGYSFTEYDVTDTSDRKALIDRTGHKTVPVIIINGELIGGCDDLFALNDSGKLDKILSNK